MWKALSLLKYMNSQARTYESVTEGNDAILRKLEELGGPQQVAKDPSKLEAVAGASGLSTADLQVRLEKLSS